MSGHVTLNRIQRSGFSVYVVVCEDCDFRLSTLDKGWAGSEMVEHALYHDQPRPKRYPVLAS